VLALLGCWLALGVSAAPPALAHAGLVSTDPPDGTRLAQAPATVTLRFSERVSLGAGVGFVRVVDQHGAEVDAGPAQHPPGADDPGADDVVAVALRPGLPDGGYLVSYQVVSADSHPVSGAVAFTVGDGPLLDSAGAVLDGTGTDALLGALLAALRWVSYTGLALLGGMVFVRVCWPQGGAHRRVRRLVWAGWLCVAVGTAGQLLGQGPYAAGRGLAALAPPGALRETLSLPLGQLLLLRVVVLLVLAVLLARLLGRHPAASRYEDMGGAAALVLLLTYAGTGHAVADPTPTAAVLADAAHLAAMSVWLGGMVMVLAGLLRLAPAAEMVAALPRFSRLAFGAVAVLAGTGVYQALATVGTPSALWQTNYGRLLSVKVLAVVVILGAASASRRATRHLRLPPPADPAPVPPELPAPAPPGGAAAAGHLPETARWPAAGAAPRRSAAAAATAVALAPARTAPTGTAPAGTAPTGTAPAGTARTHTAPTGTAPTGTAPAGTARTGTGGVAGGGAVSGRLVARLRRSVAVEVAVAVAVLAVTAVLVAQPPARVALRRPVVATADLGAAGSANLWLSPGRSGSNDLRVRLSGPVEREVSATLALPAERIGPLRVPLARAGPGNYRATVSLPRPGRWVLTIRVRTSTFDATVGEATLPVR
jgi:copper transport protein